jgi:FeS assembly SUF system protein
MNAMDMDTMNTDAMNTGAGEPQFDMEAEPPSVDSPRDHPLLPGIVAALKGVFDPEIPVNIYELGLVYKIEIDPEENVAIRMTLTAPGCPVAGEMPDQVRDAVAGAAGVGEVDVELVWDPTWHPGLMAETAKLQLGMF